MQVTDMIKLRRINKVDKLLIVDSLIKGAVKKRILDIELVDWPRIANNNGEDSVDGGGFDNRTECLIVVHTMLSHTTHRALY